jgi:putative transposase
VQRTGSGAGERGRDVATGARCVHALAAPPDAEALWQEAQGQVSRAAGILVVDDSTLDKPYSQKIERVGRHWSGKHHAVVEGINLITLLWSDGDRHVPVDYRLYDKAGDGLTKNDHFRALVDTARARGFRPRGGPSECVVFDSWYSSLENLKQVDGFGWVWLTRLKANRLVNPERQGQVPVARVETGSEGRIVHLKGYGLIRLFVIADADGEREYWATNDLNMRPLTRTRLSGYAWTIEAYHRGLKQCCGVERAQVRAARAQRNHIGLALRAFLRLERSVARAYCYHRGISWFEAKHAIIREAVRAYLREPIYQLIPTA